MSMQHSKYVIYERHDGLEVPVIFPNFIDHADMVPSHLRDKVLGAGFFQVSSGFRNYDKVVVNCFGKSTTLNLQSRGEEDAKLVSKLLQPSDPFGE